MTASVQRRRLVPGIAAALVMILVALHPSPADAGGDEVVSQTVMASFDATVTKLKKAITAHKLVIVKVVPFQKMLGMVGVKAEPIMGFEIFHPRYGKVVFENDLSAFKEAPLRILVWASGDEVTLEYRKPSAVFAGYSGLSGLGAELDSIFADIVASVAQ